MAKNYNTDEERIAAKRARERKWYQEHRAEVLQQKMEYHQEHRDRILQQKKEYHQEHRERILEQKKARSKKYYEEHRDEIRERRREYYQDNKEGRSIMLINTYKRNDKKYNRGECDLTVPWFLRNIYTKCIYCGETDWKKLGCDRINNDLPHTIENVVPACWDCNCKRQKKPFEQFYWESKHKTLGNES